MENTELIEKYIGGKLSDPELQAFEKQLQADPSLQSDVALQKHVIEGIKKARITEIKTMLSQVPIGGAMQAGLATGKIVTGIIAASAVVTGTLLYFKPWVKPAAPITKTEIPIIENKTEKPVTPVETPVEAKENKATPSPSVSNSKKETKTPKTKAVQPKIEVVDPTDELTKSTAEGKDVNENNRNAVEASHIKVETDNFNPEYSFHYQFNQGKLILYGNFDKGLYEILEVHGDTRSVFLFYKGDYYALHEKRTSVLPLIPIKDAQLIKKLNEYRSR